MTYKPTRLYTDAEGRSDPLLWRLALEQPRLTVKRDFSVTFDGTWMPSPIAEIGNRPLPLLRLPVSWAQGVVGAKSPGTQPRSAQGQSRVTDGSRGRLQLNERLSAG